MSARRGVLVTVLVAAVIVVAAVGVSVGGSTEPTEPPRFEEFNTSETVSEPLARSGTVDPAVTEESVVLIDDSNSNRFSRGDIQPLATGVGRAGAEVRFHTDGSFEEALSSADALVVVDPGTAYTSAEIDAIDDFVADGGRLLILGEPTRTAIGGGLLGVQLTERESQLTGLSSRFDIQFDTQYVYDQTENDGTYQQVVATPAADASLPPADSTALNSDASVAFSVATEVQSTGDGEPILVTSPTARTAGADTARQHTLAVRDDNVLAVGDVSFAAADRYNVGDTNVFVTAIVEFLVSDVDAGSTVEEGGSAAGGSAANETATNETATNETAANETPA